MNLNQNGNRSPNRAKLRAGLTLPTRDKNRLSRNRRAEAPKGFDLWTNDFKEDEAFKILTG